MRRRWADFCCRVLVLAFSLAALQTSAVAAEDCRTRPAWCQAGFTCEPTSCSERSTAALEGLMSQLATAQAARPRWFRPFVEGGASYSPFDGTAGLWGSAGVQVWRIQASADLDRAEGRLRLVYRREW